MGHVTLCIFFLLALSPASGAALICTSPVSAHAQFTVTSPYWSAKFTFSLFTLKTTDDNLTVCTTD